MKFSILVNAGPLAHHASSSAYHFCDAALKKGHEIHRVFFYGDGVYNASPPPDATGHDRGLASCWSHLGTDRGIDLAVCSTAAARRGIAVGHLPAGFRMAGLGQFVEAGIVADRLVVFGD